LVRDHQIDAKRVQARGVANLAPVASNAAEAGRARNRRVELVLP
jgi:flagellar motor protein MotB